MRSLGNVFNGWEAAAQQAGDSACAIYWDAKSLKPGEKREMTWAYGGGIASNPENEGKVSITLDGLLTRAGEAIELAVGQGIQAAIDLTTRAPKKK